MSTSAPRYHIPFPTGFLSLNTKPTTKNADGAVVASPETVAHNFLSNRTTVPRHSSISSQSSIGTITSTPSTPPTQAVEVKAAAPAFLTLNSKYTAPPTTASVGDKTPFLSNKPSTRHDESISNLIVLEQE